MSATTPAAATLLLFVLSSTFLVPCLQLVEAPKPINYATSSHITVMGMVYCDICSNNTFSAHSYFLPGVRVKIDCIFKASAPRTAEEITLSVNRTTNRYGIYKLDIPAVDGIECARERAVGSVCRASLMSSSSPACNLPGSTTTSDQIAIKSRVANTCIYSLSALNYRPSKINTALCPK